MDIIQPIKKGIKNLMKGGTTKIRNNIPRTKSIRFNAILR